MSPDNEVRTIIHAWASAALLIRQADVSQNEIKVFFAIGSEMNRAREESGMWNPVRMSITRIASDTGMNRTRTRNACFDLVKRGFLRMSKVDHFLTEFQLLNPSNMRPNGLRFVLQHETESSHVGGANCTKTPPNMGPNGLRLALQHGTKRSQKHGTKRSHLSNKEEEEREEKNSGEPHGTELSHVERLENELVEAEMPVLEKDELDILEFWMEERRKRMPALGVSPELSPKQGTEEKNIAAGIVHGKHAFPAEQLIEILRFALDHPFHGPRALQSLLYFSRHQAVITAEFQSNGKQRQGTKARWATPNDDESWEKKHDGWTTIVSDRDPKVHAVG